MLYDGKIWAGTGASGAISLLPGMANRHGLIAGATGTGKTVTLKVLAEGFSDLGVPVFLSDIKGDLSGMIQPGERTEALDGRLEKCGVPPEAFSFKNYPTIFWDLYGEQGHPIRATVEAMGPLLLSRMLSLNETQTGVMSILFRVAHDERLPLEDIKDLKSMLKNIGERARELTLEYGNVSMASIGAIQRAVAVLEDQGGNAFFGTPAINIGDWMLRDEEDRGYINVLAADRLFNNPAMYSSFLLWMLTELYDFLPERGDSDKPGLVFFFDEAHLLFNNCGRALMEKIEQVVRLIRSKGVGVYFITQNPTDIPMTILGQLGNRVQHALRAYTPLDQKAVRVAAQTFRTNPSFDTEEAITTLKTGEALISFLDEHGAPGVVERATILPPQSRLGAISEAERARHIMESPMKGRYDDVVDGVGAYEILNPRPVMPAFPLMTPFTVQVSTAQTKMAQTFKVYDPTTGQYVIRENPNAAPEAPAVPSIQQPAVPQPEAQAVPSIPVQAPVYQAPVPDVQSVPVQAPVYQAPVYQPAPEAQAPVYQAPVYQPAPEAQAPVYQQPLQGIVQPAQTVPTIQVQPQVQQMPVMVQDPVTGQYVQQMMTFQLDPATGNYIPVQQAPVVTDPKVLAEQQKAAEKAAREAARAAKEQEAAERRARNDALREEAAERARRNDSVAGRVKNTAISTATRQVVSSLTKGVTKAVENLIGGNKK